MPSAHTFSASFFCSSSCSGQSQFNRGFQLIQKHIHSDACDSLTRCCFCSAIDWKFFQTSSPPSATAVCEASADVPTSEGASARDFQLAELMATSAYDAQHGGMSCCTNGLFTSS